MRLLLLIALISLVSCGNENQTKEEKLTYQRQSLAESSIQCVGIKTDIIEEKITCPTSLINEEAQFLFSIDEELIEQDKLKRHAVVELEVVTQRPIQAYFYLVSKYGKRLSEDMLYNGFNSIKFKELRIGDFSAHDVYLKISNYHTGGTPVAVARIEDKGCDTGLFNVEDINLDDLRGQCPNLKFIPNFKAEVESPKFYEGTKKFPKMKRVDYKVYQITSKYRLFDHMTTQQVPVEKLYELKKTEFGFELEQIEDRLCFTEGFYDHKVYEEKGIYLPFGTVYEKVNRGLENSEASKLCKNCGLGVNDRSFSMSENLGVKKCYPVEPKLVGTILIKE
ncbi:MULTISPECIES: hypothetical protein [unclassified Halobacteriovorax]|uniref:hypothetical protein n=1 Tax=unclassified Halobacteriovorax TaxID=2639665 RepID=UPI002FF2EA2E